TAGRRAGPAALRPGPRLPRARDLAAPRRRGTSVAPDNAPYRLRRLVLWGALPGTRDPLRRLLQSVPGAAARAADPVRRFRRLAAPGPSRRGVGRQAGVLEETAGEPAAVVRPRSGDPEHAGCT